MSLTSKPEFALFKDVSRLVFYLILGLSLFFGAALLILSLRQQSARKFQMKNLTGKYYIDVHNELQRDQLRVELAYRSYPDMPPGIILHQNIAPGTLIRPRKNIVLTVNKPEPRIPMPRFIGNTLLTAKASLSRLTYGDRIYSLQIAAVTRVADGSPRDIILAQFPPPGKKISVNEKIFLLVSQGPSRRVGKTRADLKKLKEQHLAIAREFFHRRKEDYRVRFVTSPMGPDDSGRITELSKDSQGRFQLAVVFNPAQARFENGYEKAKAVLNPPPGGGGCLAEIRPVKKKPKKGGETFLDPREPRRVFQSQARTPGETIEFLYYRMGPSELEVTCGDRSMLRQVLRPDDFS